MKPWLVITCWQKESGISSKYGFSALTFNSSWSRISLGSPWMEEGRRQLLDMNLPLSHAT